MATAYLFTAVFSQLSMFTTK